MNSFGVCTFSFQMLRRPELVAAHGLPCPGSFDGLIDLAVRFGLSSVEAPLKADTPLEEAARLRQRAEAAGLRMVLAGGLIEKSPLEALIPLAAALGGPAAGHGERAGGGLDRGPAQPVAADRPGGGGGPVRGRPGSYRFFARDV